jgi:predicted RNase H-like nuclease (RuvC/YqgF family)
MATKTYIAGFVGAVIALLGEEKVAIPYRIKKATRIGYQTGYQKRSIELEPKISDLENQVNEFSSRISSLENTVAEKDRLIQELKEKLDSVDIGS